MKLFAGEIASILATRGQRPRIGVLVRFLVTLAVMVSSYAVIFKLLMAREGQEQTWVTAFYWVLTVMSTLGFGDITFHTDVGRGFSILVLLSGMLFLLVLLPFIFIEFFYQPWLESQTAARTPRSLKQGTRGHVIVTHFDAVAAALISRLERYQRDYVLLVSDSEEGLGLLDHGYRVVVGAIDDPETYLSVQVGDAALVVATGSDAQNTLVCSTVRGVSESVPIVATADDSASIDVLALAGCREVIHLPSLMGQALARRVVGGDHRAQTIGNFGEIQIAEANTENTELVGKSIRDSEVRNKSGVGIIGVWDRGAFEPALPDTVLGEKSVLLLAGTPQQIAAYDQAFGNPSEATNHVVILGGGRVGQLTARVLSHRGIPHTVVERDPQLAQEENWVVGNAAELSVLRAAGIDRASKVIITTHDDDMNVYLTLYCRKLQPKVKILCRAADPRNVHSIHRAGADFVLSYASMGANALFNALELGSVMMVAEGLNLFRVDVPRALHGRNLIDSAIRARTGATVVAIESREGEREIGPAAETELQQGQRLVLAGDPEIEERFLAAFS